ncbi:hypothetical protein [Tunturiibacter lichenicola]
MGLAPVNSQSLCKSCHQCKTLGDQRNTR